MREYQYFVLNVFSEVGLGGGNQLAVIPNAEGLTDEQMQLITRQFNYSESTFVVNKNDKSAEFRIFTPGKEIAYAGHPTVGTINVLETLSRKEGNEPRSNITAYLKGGSVEGVIETEKGEINFVGFSQKLASLISLYSDKNKLSKLLGVDINSIVGEKFPIIAVTAMKFLIVELKDPITVQMIEPDLQGLTKPEFKDDDISVFVYSRGGLDGGDVKTRCFVPLYGIVEDPATGGIQSSFCLALHMAGYLKDNSINNIITEQGYEVNRPSKIHNKITVKEGEIQSVFTGGKCYHFSEGILRI